MKKQKALVTGASSGIGMAFARELAMEGFDVTCVARNEKKLKKLIEELGGSHRYILADLAAENDLATLCQDIRESCYSLLVNNAGYGIYDRFVNIPLDKTDHLIRVNINALVHLSHAYLANASEGDALINVSSVLSLLPYPGGAVYSGTKAFVTNFSEALWYECRDMGVYVMALLPGATDTNFHRVAIGRKDAGTPDGLSYPPEVVVRDAISALKDRRQPTIISGPRFRMLAALATRLLSRKKRVVLMGGKSAGLQ